MTLTVADIDRWNAGAVREVFRAASCRGLATLDAARQLSTLSVFDTWRGATAAARQHANDVIRVDLDAHGSEALAVARAADQAADGIEHVQAELAALRRDAARLRMLIAATTNDILPTADCPPAQAIIAVLALRPRLEDILTAADAVDGELATAIDMADGDRPVDPASGPPVGPSGLTPAQRAGDANHERVREERAIAKVHIEGLTAAVTRTAGDRARLEDLTTQLRAARHRMEEFDAIGTALARAPETYLTVLDVPADPGRKIRAAVAVGNPDTAGYLTVTVPGLTTTIKDSLPRMVGEARNLKSTTEAELRRFDRPGPVATIAWIGYEPPPNPIATASPRDLWRTMSDGRAREGAAALAPYLQRLRAANPGTHLSLFGHSYGSLTSSLALQQLNAHGEHPVDDVVFYGSPGLELDNPGQLGLPDGHAYVMKAPPGHDWVTELAPLAPLHGWGADPYAGLLPELSSQAGTSPDGVARAGVRNHADYPRAYLGPGGVPTLGMAGYNLAVVAAGIADLPGGAAQLMMAPTPSTPYPHLGRR